MLEHLDTIAAYTGTDIFLLGPRLTDPDTAGSHFNGSPDTGLDHRLRAAVYGDMESAEHAKTRTLIMVDQILKRTVDAMKVDLSLHTMICGRSRKHIKLIESATDTAIYFPPPFPHVYGYTPPGAHRRSEDEVFITGAKAENIAQAKAKLQELVLSSKCYLKDVMVSSNKIDGILLDRMDKVRKITENNGSFILFPQLGTQRGFVRVQATEISHVERTVKDLMALAGQFYSATWWILVPDPASAASAAMRAPSPADVRTMLSDICTNSGADVSFDRFTFTINGSDDAVKAAMMVIHQIPFVKRARYQMRVKIELANEHKEFVSGKKNGKINKIMGQSRSSNPPTIAGDHRPLAINPLTAPLQAMSRSSSTVSTSTTSTSTCAGASTRQRGMAWTWWSRRCRPRLPSTCRISITSASSALVDSTSSGS